MTINYSGTTADGFEADEIASQQSSAFTIMQCTHIIDLDTTKNIARLRNDAKDKNVGFLFYNGTDNDCYIDVIALKDATGKAFSGVSHKVNSGSGFPFPLREVKMITGNFLAGMIMGY